MLLGLAFVHIKQIHHHRQSRHRGLHHPLAIKNSLSTIAITTVVINIIVTLVDYHYGILAASMVTVAVEIVADGTAIEEVGALVVVCVSVWSCDRAEKGGDRDG